VGPTEGESTWRQGRLVTGAAWATAGRLLRGAHRCGRPRRHVRAREQACTGNPPQRTRELTGARTARGHEHQGDGAKPRLEPAKAKTFGTCAVRGEVRSLTTPEKTGCLPEPVKSAYGVAARWATPTLDGTRPTGRLVPCPQR
jgi:hypothetical protein